MATESTDKNKEVTLFVNTRPKAWTEKYITYEQAIALAYGTYDPQAGTAYTVNYSKSGDERKEGSLVAGAQVKTKDGMVINVSRTNQS
jgi:hypothetical protein